MKLSWPRSLFLIGLPIFLALYSCKSRPPASQPPVTDIAPAPPVISEPMAEESSEPEVYKGPQERTWDLLHTELRVSFDWEQRRLNGEAMLRATPLFYDQDSIHLDAKGFELHSVMASGQPLPYHYDLLELSIALPRTMTRRDTLTLNIRYTARPHELGKLGLEEDANDHGLYFINHKGAELNKPRQIWTQGETEANSCWFPTFDQPNERCTQEMFITVDSNFVTLSNGRFEGSSFKGAERTDHWNMVHPHAPYLFAMAIGEFAVVRDSWRGRPVDYYVEPEYGPHARAIFGNTPEMLTFFSEKLGVEYPFDKYSQVVVRDFVSGAMENTTATIHFDGLQRTTRELLDGDLESIVSHELMHQWFGDLVTCESWAQLTLNEAFATYGEYMWIEYKYGPKAAMDHLLSDRRAYLGESKYNRHNLIHFAWGVRDDMFDGHTYQKGGQILHMLRKLVGDEAFFASLEYYLQKNAFSDVEADELRMAFEDITGRDLKWFFDQWFFSQGHPELRVVHRYRRSRYQLEIKQEQSGDDPAVFRFPVLIDVIMEENGPHQMQLHWIESRDTVLTIAEGQEPYMVDFNADGVLLAEINEEKPTGVWMAQFNAAQNVYQQYTALSSISQRMMEADTLALVQSALRDPHKGVARLALDYVRTEVPEDALYTVRADLMALIQHPEANVRTLCLQILDGKSEFIRANWEEAWQDELKLACQKATADSSMRTQQSALYLLHSLDPTLGLARAHELESEASGNLIQAIGLIYARANDPQTLPYITRMLETTTSSRIRSTLVRALGILWEDHQSDAGRELLRKMGIEDPIWWVRMGAYRALGNMSIDESTREYFRERKQVETNKMVVDLLQGLIDKPAE